MNDLYRGTQEVLLRCQKLEGAQQSTPKGKNSTIPSTQEGGFQLSLTHYIF